MQVRRVFCTKTELLIFEVILPFPKIDNIGVRLKSNGGDLPVDMQLLVLSLLLLLLLLLSLLLSNVDELNNSEKKI